MNHRQQPSIALETALLLLASGTFVWLTFRPLLAATFLAAIPLLLILRRAPVRWIAPMWTMALVAGIAVALIPSEVRYNARYEATRLAIALAPVEVRFDGRLNEGVYVRPIVYGYPMSPPPFAVDGSPSGPYLGGCIVYDDSPKYVVLIGTRSQ